MEPLRLLINPKFEVIATVKVHTFHFGARQSENCKKKFHKADRFWQNTPADLRPKNDITRKSLAGVGGLGPRGT